MVKQYQSAKNKQFSFELDGRPFTIKGLPFDELAAAQKGTPAEQAEQIPLLVGKFADKRTTTAILTLDQGDLHSFFQDWAGGKLGESDGSSTPSASTEPTSSMTSGDSSD